MAWFTKLQAEGVVQSAHERVGKAWSWMGKAMKEAIIAREVAMLLADQQTTDGLLTVGDINDLFGGLVRTGRAPTKQGEEARC